MTIKVNWFTPVNHRDYNRMAASIWIRCYQLLPYLARRGVACTVNDPKATADVSVFVRWQDAEAYRLAVSRKAEGERIVFDLVVNYFDEARTPYLGKTVTTRHIAEAQRMLSVADAVSCSSNFIAGRARRQHDHVTYLADSVDRRHFRHVKAEGDFYRPRLRAIWSGASVKARELEPIAPLLLERNLELTIVSDKRPHLRMGRRAWLRRVPLRFLRWRYEAFPAQILEGEICCVHRPVADPYNRGHSHFKIGVFMAEGVPALASPVPSYIELLGSGASGRICATIEEWADALDAVIADRGMLVAWSREAAQTMNPHTTEAVVERYVDLFAGLCGSTARPAAAD